MKTLLPALARGGSSLAAVALLGAVSSLPAGEQTTVLRDYIQQSWSNELVTFPFSASEGTCLLDSVTLAGPRGPMPVQLSQVEYWPGKKWVKSAMLSFIADLAPLATNRYTVRYAKTAAIAPPPNTDLSVTPGPRQVEIITSRFGLRLLLGEETYAKPVAAASVPGPVAAMRLADGTWFGGSRMYGPGKLQAWSAQLTDRGPVFARAAVRYTYQSGNTLDLTVQVAAGDNTARIETCVQKHQPYDGFNLVLNRGLPPLVFQVEDEGRVYEARQKGRDYVNNPLRSDTLGFQWVDVPLADYVAPKGYPTGLITALTPWRINQTFALPTIRLRLQGTSRELQLRVQDAGAWVEPRQFAATRDPARHDDPANGDWVRPDSWISLGEKQMPLRRDPSGDVLLQASAAQGLRKWTMSECLSMPGVAATYHPRKYKSESEFPRETRAWIGTRLNQVKDFILDWPGDAGKHPRLFMNRAELEAAWKRNDVDPAVFKTLLANGSAGSVTALTYCPNSAYPAALGAYLLSGGSPDVAATTQLVARLRQSLQYDIWAQQFWGATTTPILYDALIDNPLISDEERPVLRARMAWFGYRLNDPAVWSSARGYQSGNPNMSVCHEISRGIVACAIPEHPMAKTWYRNGEILMESSLRAATADGEYLESLGVHGRPSVDMMLTFALASRNAGFHDYLSDPRFKRVMLHFAKMLTPRDPRRRGPINFGTYEPNWRYFPAYSRDGISQPGGNCGVWAHALRSSDPEFSALMQWAWLEEGAVPRLDKLGGFENVIYDKKLPSAAPRWISETFPLVGAVLRHGLATPDEHQVILYSGDNFCWFYPSQIGSFPSIFAYGKPVAGSFPAPYQVQADGLLTCHVQLARGLGTMEERTGHMGYKGYPRNKDGAYGTGGPTARFGERGGVANLTAFSALPRQDYATVDAAFHFPRDQSRPWAGMMPLPEWPPVPAAGKPPVDWRRQVLFLKDDDPAKTAYLLIRDTVQGGQPTMWQMWNVSEKIGTPGQVKDLAAFLADKPGNQVVPARQLKGDRFTAIGQFGVDVEYYIASPTGTPRYTLRWGTNCMYPSGEAREPFLQYLIEPEYQDLLHLQMAGDGAYYVAFFPRKRNMPVPTFQTLGGGLIIKTSGDFGTDYGFLSARETAATSEDVSFKGTAASVQDRQSGPVLSLGAKGEVRYRGYALAADFAASLRIGQEKLVVELPEKAIDADKTLAPMIPFPGGTITLMAAGNWTLAKPVPGVRISKSGPAWALQVPSGVREVTLTSMPTHP